MKDLSIFPRWLCRWMVFQSALGLVAVSAAPVVIENVDPGRRLALKNRSLQTSDVCVDPSVYFVKTNLGDAVSEGSHYKTTGVVLSFIDGRSEFFGVDITSLASYYASYELLTNGFDFTPYFGRNGEYTDELVQQQALAIEFWGADRFYSDILLYAVHSEVLEFGDALNTAVKLWANLTLGDFVDLLDEDDYESITNDARFAIEVELGGYDNPILTFNAGARPFQLVAGFDQPPASIEMGDGTLEYLAEEYNVGEIGNDFVHAHEFCHLVYFQIMYEKFGFDLNGMLDRLFLDKSAEESREDELYADACAAYFLAEARQFPVDSLRQCALAGYAIGDCLLDHPGHHGTPKQRECAAIWGAKQGLPVGDAPYDYLEFYDRFIADLDLILELDPIACAELQVAAEPAD